MKKIKTVAIMICLIMFTGLIVGCQKQEVKQEASTTATNVSEPTKTPENFVMPATQVEVKTDEKSTVFVDASKGNDSNAGTVDAPVQTLQKAQQLAREKTSGMTEDVVVYLREGTYVLDETLKFTSADSGKNGFSVVWTSYKGETVTISGGTQISGWTLADESKNIWSAPANGVESRDFYINGERAVIARGPELKDMGQVDDIKAFTKAKGGGYPDTFARPQDLDIVATAAWVYNFLKVKDVKIEGNFQRIYMTNDSWTAMTSVGGVRTQAESLLYMENAYELLDEPGEWYMNPDEDKVYYIPKDGQDLSSADTVLGKLEKIVSFEGELDNTVDNITLTGLTFSYSTWLQASRPEGFVTLQSNVYRTPELDTTSASYGAPISAVHGSFVNNVNITYNVFINLGSGGVHLESAVKNSSIKNNYVTECGGSGISLGGFGANDHHPIKKSGKNYDEGIKYVTENNNITDNYVTNIGTVYKSGCAILVGYVARTNIEYNTLTNLHYTGISIGWGWGHGKAEMGGTYYIDDEGKFLLCDNRVANNYIENIMNTLIDGGGIYTLGRMDNTVLENNYINQVNNEFGGIYLDNGSYGFTVTNNVLSNCHRNWIYKGDYNYIYDNYTSSGTAKEEDYDLREPYRKDELDNYKFENNYMWDEAKINEIKNAAGVRK